MFAFSKVHSWQGEEAVQQVLVFPTSQEQKRFESIYKERVEKDGIKVADDSGIGAIYKLRAIKQVNGVWAAVIRSGYDGELLCESRDTFQSANLAIDYCYLMLIRNINVSISIVIY